MAPLRFFGARTSTYASSMAPRALSDEYYVLDLCDELLGTPCARQHTFDWLLGDVSPKTGRRKPLPVDGYWAGAGLVVEFAESQHDAATPHFDKPHRLTVSGVHRGIQRRIYDQRRRELIPAHNLLLVTIPARAFTLRRRRIARDRDSDLATVRHALARAGIRTSL